MKLNKKRILVDLDGVLNQYGKDEYDENYIPKIKEGAEEFLNELCKDSELYLFTSRNLLLTSKWLIDNRIDKFFKDVTNTKLPSFLHIDDRAICFNGNYNETLNKIKNFQTYWSKTTL